MHRAMVHGISPLDELYQSEAGSHVADFIAEQMRYEKMSLPDRLMMKVTAIMIKYKKNKTEQDIGFEEGIKSSFDHSSKKYIEPLILYLRTNAQHDRK